MPAKRPSSTRSAAPTQGFKVELSGMDAVERLNSLKRFPVDFRRSGKAPIKVSLEGGQSDTFCVWQTHSRSGFVTVPTEADDLVTIRFVTDGWLLRRNQNDDYVGRPGIGMLIPFEDMSEQRASDNFSSVSGTIRRSALSAASGALRGGDDRADVPSLAPVVEMVGTPMTAFQRNFRLVNERLRAGVTQDDLAFPLIEEIMIYQLLTVWPKVNAPIERAVPTASARQIGLAVDYIEANLAKPLKIADVAAAAGISVRSLQTRFSKEIARTPLQYIYDRRLESVHADLRSEALQRLPIMQIASRFGFVHASYFSRRYKERYGCTPMETRNSIRTKSRRRVVS